MDCAFNAGFEAPGAGAYDGHTACIAVLLAAGASTTAECNTEWRALHAAAAGGVPAVVRQVLAAAPHVALQGDRHGRTPLAVALEEHRLEYSHSPASQFAEVVQCLLTDGPLQPADELLSQLGRAGQQALRLHAAAVAAASR